MTAATGSAMQMQLTLSSLMRRHGAIGAKPCIIPLASPIDGPIDVSGLASTTDIDLTRQKFRGWAFSNLCLYLKGYPFPKLLYRHDESEVAGEITKLSYEDRGQLRISAQVSHERAKRCTAFSVTARILEYEIREADSPDFHALISNAEIVEISLTDRPANPRALVLSRTPTAPTPPFIQAMGQQANLAIKAVG